MPLASIQQFQMTADSPVNQYMIVSHEPTGGAGLPVYVRISTSSTANVALPSNSTAQYAIVVPPDTVMIVSGPQRTALPQMRVCDLCG
jgi:hypothetical protein